MRFVEKKGKALVFEINGNRPAAAGGRERGKGRFIRTGRMRSRSLHI
jgi:hypothetical protein